VCLRKWEELHTSSQESVLLASPGSSTSWSPPAKSTISGSHSPPAAHLPIRNLCEISPARVPQTGIISCMTPSDKLTPYSKDTIESPLCFMDG